MAIKKVKAAVKKVASKVKKTAVAVAKKTIAPASKMKYTAPKDKTVPSSKFKPAKPSTPGKRQPGFVQAGEKGYKPMLGKNLTYKKKK